jgi:pilus assembly protein CpaE
MTIAFLGSKGGTGTTMLAVNCAADIHRHSGQPVLIADVKQGPGDVAVFLGLRPRLGLVNAIDQVAWSDTAEAARYVAEHDCGLHVLSGAEAFGRPSARDAEAVEQLLHRYEAMYEYVVIDVGSTLTATAVAALTSADLVLLVANPDVLCLRNLQRLSDALRLAGVAPERVHIVLNRTSENGLLLVPQIEGVLGRPIEFQVTSDYRTVAASVNTGVPVACLRPSELQAQIDAIARALIARHLAQVALQDALNPSFT